MASALGRAVIGVIGGVGAAMIASGALAAQAAPRAPAAATKQCPPMAAFSEGQFIATDRVPQTSGALVERVKRAKADRRELERKADIRIRPTGASVTITTWGALIPGRTVVLARRNAGGTWSVLDVRDNEPGSRRTSDPDLVVKRGTIAKPAAARLAALLADPCLYAEPIYIGNEYPLTDGGEGGCFDGGDTLVEIVLPGRRRTAFHACIPYGLTAELVREIGKATP
jgi:hypothetical protein